MHNFNQDSPDFTVSLLAANLYSLVIVLPLAALVLAVIYLLHGFHILVDGFYYWNNHPVPAILILLGGIIVHEALHALAWLVVAKNQWNAIKFGFHVSALSPYAHCTEPMPVGSYRVTVILPGVLLGAVPLTIGILFGNGPVLLFGFLFTLAAGGDALVLWRVRNIPPGTLVRDHPDRAGCVVIAESRKHNTSV